MSEICFVEARPRDPVTGEEVVVRLAGGGVKSPYYRDGQHYRAGLVDMPRFRAGFGFDDNGWTGTTMPTSGVIGFMSGDGQLVGDLSALYWRDAPITIDAGEEGAALARRLTGAVAGAANNEGQLALALADPGRVLDKPFLGAFDGSGGLEGPTEAAGRVKRRTLGLVFNVQGHLLDKAYSIYEFGDPAHRLSNFAEVRDKGRAGPLVELGWQGSRTATFAALQAAEVPQGGCVAAPSIACVKWWTEPAGPLTADIEGEIAGGYADKPAEIAARLLAAVDGPTIDDLAVAAALRPATSGIHIALSADTVAQALDRLFLGCSLYWVLQPTGTIRIGEWAWTAPVASFQADFISRERQLPPVKSRQVGYRRNHRVHQASEISAAVLLADDVTYLDGTPIEDLQPAERGATDGATVGGGGNPGNIRDETGAIRPASDLLNASIALTDAGRLLVAREVGPPTDLGQINVRALGGASAAAERQQRDALDRLAAVVTMIDTRLASTQGVLRDAGIYVDPGNGRVTISAVDATAERVNDVSILLDGVKSELLLKATTTYVDNAIAQAVIDPEQVPVFTALEARVTSAEVRLDGAEAQLILKADAVTLSALTATVTEVSQDLDALAGLVSTKVSNTTFGALETRVATAEDSLTALGDVAAIERGVGVARMTARNLDDEAAATLAGLLAADARQREMIDAQANVREEITARLIDGDAVEAMARQELAAKVNDAMSSIDIASTILASVDRQVADLLTVVATQGVTVSDQATAITDINGKIAGRRTMVVDVDGNITGIDMIGAPGVSAIKMMAESILMGGTAGGLALVDGKAVLTGDIDIHGALRVFADNGNVVARIGRLGP